MPDIPKTRSVGDVISYVRQNPNGRVRFDGDAELLIAEVERLRGEQRELFSTVGPSIGPILEQLRMMEKYQLTCLPEPGEERDGSVMRFALGMTRKALGQASKISELIEPHPTEPGMYRRKEDRP